MTSNGVAQARLLQLAQVPRSRPDRRNRSAPWRPCARTRRAGETPPTTGTRTRRGIACGQRPARAPGWRTTTGSATATESSWYSAMIRGDPADCRVDRPVGHHLAGSRRPARAPRGRHPARSAARAACAVHREHVLRSTGRRPGRAPRIIASASPCPAVVTSPTRAPGALQDRVRADGGAVAETLGPLEQSRAGRRRRSRPAVSARPAPRPPDRPWWTTTFARPVVVLADPPERSR